MGRWLTLLVGFVLTATPACRKLTDPTTEVRPEFLGDFSGIYAGIDERPGIESGTIVVQFRDKLLVSPFTTSLGTDVRFSWFATRVELQPAQPGSDVRRVIPVESSMILPPADILGEGSKCDDSGGDPGWSYSDLVVNELQCANQGCQHPCYFISPFDSTDRALGDCLTDESCLHDRNGVYDPGPNGACTVGDWCYFPDLTIAGEFDSTGMRFFFDTLALLPPTRTATPCPTDDDSGYDWLACFRYHKLCEFDSRLAGVYRLTLTYDAGASTRTPTETTRELDIGVAIADNIEAAVLFDGDRAFFGTFESFGQRLRVDDGESLDDPQIRFRAPDRLTRIDATLTEVAAANEIQLNGTWTETELGTGNVAVFALSGVRSSGSAAGRTCAPPSGCPAEPVTCPGGYETPPGNQLFFEDNIASNGCLLQRCTRMVGRAALCPGSDLDCPTPGATPVPFEGSEMIAVAYDVSVECRSGDATCALADACLSVTCADPRDVGFENLGFVDLACLAPGAAGPIMMTFEEVAGFIIVSCPPDQPPYCSPFAPVCIFDPLFGMPSSLEPIQTDPCFEPVCWQTITTPYLCGATFADITPCTGTDVLYPTIDTSGCVTFACQPGDFELQGVPCYAIPGTDIPPASTLTLGLDVADLYGCPLYRPHQP